MITIPAAVLDALGGLREGDAPVMYTRGAESCWLWHPRWCLADEEGWMEVDCLILPASAPALLQVLARHVGLALAEGEVPTWTHIGGDVWWLQGGTSIVRFSGTGKHIAIPTLQPSMSRMRALAEVVVHLATKRENAADRIRHGNQHDTRGEKNASARLTEEDVRAIRVAREDGVSLRSLAIAHGVSESTISAIANRRRWAWVE